MHQIDITAADCEAASGITGLQGLIAGLRLMQSWAEEHAPGWRYQAARRRFQFLSAADLERFSNAFLSRAEP